jgi:hypothetical protein
MGMFKPKSKHAIWIEDSAARAFLGLRAPTASSSRSSRWAILGEFIEEATIGIWIHVDHVQEWTHDGDTWKVTGTMHVTPPTCLVRWNFVITIQLLEKFEDLKVAGFQER